MAQLIASKDNAFDGVLAATSFYPQLKISEFQSLFHFLADGKETGILHAAKVARIAIHQELKALTTKYATLGELSQNVFGDDESAEILYKQAVFCKTAHSLITNRLSTDATKDAAQRQAALMDQVNEQLTNYRSAIVQLLPEVTGYTVALI